MPTPRSANGWHRWSSGKDSESTAGTPSNAITVRGMAQGSEIKGFSLSFRKPETANRPHSGSPMQWSRQRPIANLRLTECRIDTVEPGKSARDVRDTDIGGFGVRILPRRAGLHLQGSARRIAAKRSQTASGGIERRLSPGILWASAMRMTVQVPSTASPRSLQRTIASTGRPGVTRMATLRTCSLPTAGGTTQAWNSASISDMRKTSMSGSQSENGRKPNLSRRPGCIRRWPAPRRRRRARAPSRRSGGLSRGPGPARPRPPQSAPAG